MNGRPLEFGPFVLDPGRLELRRRGLRIHVPVSRLRLLLLFASRPGELVTREEVAACLWKDQQNIDVDSGINTALNQLRHSLGDEPSAPKYIETVTGAGYRFIAAVIAVPAAEISATETRSDGLDSLATSAPAQEIEEVHAGRTSNDIEHTVSMAAVSPAHGITSDPKSASAVRWWTRERALVASVVAAILIAVAVYFSAHGWAGGGKASHPDLELTRIALGGDIEAADISPDGRYLAYVRNTQGQQSLWLSQLASGPELQLAALGIDFCPGIDFSPDGNSLYFVRMQRAAATGTLYRIAILGGDPQRVLDGISGAPSISPDGLSIAFVRSTLATHGVDSLVTARIDGSNERVLKSYEAPGIHFNRVTWTGDGKTLVYPVDRSLIAIPADGGDPHALPASGWISIEDVRSLASGRDLLVVGRLPDTRRAQIYLAPLDGGSARLLTHDLSNYTTVRATADGKTLLAIERVQLSAIETVDPGRESETHRLTAENQSRIGVSGLAWTPDGRIAYTTESEQRAEIDLISKDGSSTRQVLSTSSDVTDLAVSPLGDSIVFTQWSAGDKANLWRVDFKDGHEQRLTSGQQDFPASLSPDGQWIIYASILGDKSVLMKIPAQGGTPVQLTTDVAEYPSVSPDGKWIAYACFPKPDHSPELAIMSFDGSRSIRTFELPESADLVHLAWSPDGKAVAFVNRLQDVSNIWQQPIAGGQPTQITHFDSGTILNLQWSHDGSLALSRGVEYTDAVMIRSFR